MNRIALPLAIVLISSASFAQSAPVATVRPAPETRVYRLSTPLTARTSEPLSTQHGDRQGDKQGELGVWMGLSLQLRKDGAERLEVLQVIPGSPAERAGAKVGDKLVALAGRPVTNHDSLLDVLRTRHPGERVQLTVERSAKLKLSESPDEDKEARLGVNTVEQADSKSSDVNGRGGLAITSLTSGMAAESSGFVVGERICAVDGKEIGSFKELKAAIQAHKPGDEVEIRSQRDVVVELAARPNQADSGRAVAGMGSHAFGGGSPQASGQPGLGGGLFSPQQGNDWPSTPGPSGPHSLPQTQNKGAQPRLALPSPQTGDGHTEMRSPNPSGAQDGIRVQLLEEIRALRKEVAELRRQIDGLREQKSKNAR